ncbi:SNARE Slt1 [Schizosaccharomyces japonicus yFS275]|uniref:SNARE Slt1 n=1 Tax=Schizosaccharomyces japonicus (strain yFS275 / FY16936) TaxID=402676 RepID=B6K0M8_SCHJY|nr:SNARE Slt1 [Schizosaccharomyces japonicus yFS275]EEB07499.1 SNARE Slt1 [Schizosaccharomyces japonicus yFS275]
MAEDLLSSLEKSFQNIRKEIRDPLDVLKFEKNLDYARKLFWENGENSLLKIGEPSALAKRFMALQGELNEMRAEQEMYLDYKQQEFRKKEEERLEECNHQLRQRRLTNALNKQEHEEEHSTARILTQQRSLQSEISSSLLSMASILKQNALSFTNALVQDAHVIQRTGETLEGNQTKLETTNERVMKYVRSKKLGFWKRLSMVLTAVVAFIVMLFIIHFTK